MVHVQEKKIEINLNEKSVGKRKALLKIIEREKRACSECHGAISVHDH